MINNNKEMGSFIELQFLTEKEFYKGEKNIIRLNTGRAAIWHAFRLTKCNCIWIPLYQCECVSEFLRRKRVEIHFYYIDRTFEPLNLEPNKNDAVLLVNYFGIMSEERMRILSLRYKNVIIDNSQAFFAKPIEHCFNVYSARKFVGVPDGAYVIGENADLFNEEYLQGYSSDTSSFLLMRHEYGCEGKAYEARMLNEDRLDREDIKQMSALTRKILDGIYYTEVIRRRKKNFEIASRLFEIYNQIQVERYLDEDCVPMVYPLMIEDENIIKLLLKKGHFQGRWWQYLISEEYEGLDEYWFSRYIIPITIDQRYDVEDIKSLYQIVMEGLKH